MTKPVRPRSVHCDRGVVAVEAALVVPVLVFVLALACAVIVTVTAKMSLVDASREAARLAARGEKADVAVEAARRLAPPHSSVRLVVFSGSVEAVVTTDVRPLRVLPVFHLVATARAEREDAS